MAGLGKKFSNNLSSAGVLPSCENSKDPQQDLSSSTVSQMKSIDDNSFLNRGAWVPPQQQFQRKRIYAKVFKRGALGRSIDMARYSGYAELKQDLARRFSIEGQLEDQQRIGWKLVYMDHDDDVLLVGEDPWEEFVNCVCCIKILSPEEAQQMSFIGDFGNPVLPNQAFSKL